jgi:hypothetical protein
MLPCVNQVFILLSFCLICGWGHTECGEALPVLSLLNGQYQWYSVEVCSNSHGVAETGCFSCDTRVLQPVLLHFAVCLTVVVDISGSKLKWLKNTVVCTNSKTKA